jgi:hypothetical protein
MPKSIQGVSVHSCENFFSLPRLLDSPIKAWKTQGVSTPPERLPAAWESLWTMQLISGYTTRKFRSCGRNEFSVSRCHQAERRLRRSTQTSNCCQSTSASESSFRTGFLQGFGTCKTQKCNEYNTVLQLTNCSPLKRKTFLYPQLKFQKAHWYPQQINRKTNQKR